ncbi:MAG: hypothetical protein H0W76_13725 [Pyrinomonadaceae bacterium]|nr:hypothetical protein [Pyrinomonadaceae bacterium]
MLKKSLIITLAYLLLLTALGFQPTYAQSTRDSQTAERMRAEVAKLGVSKAARVEVKLRDKTKLKGYISKIADDSFTLVDSDTGASHALNYADVVQVKKPGKGLSAKIWIIVGVAAAAAVIVGVTVIKPVLCDGGAGC